MSSIRTKRTLGRMGASAARAGAATIASRTSAASRGVVISRAPLVRDRKSTRLNSSHANISYAVFCLKKKKHNIMRLQVVDRTSRSDLLYNDDFAAPSYRQLLHVLQA